MFPVMAKTTRSGKRYYTPATAAAEEDDIIQRGTLRGGEGKAFRRVSRGYYQDLQSLRRAHKTIFAHQPSFFLLERPTSEDITGLAQAVLRLHVDDPDKKTSLLKAYSRLAELYVNRSWIVTITANVVLASKSARSYSIFWGQVS